MKINKIIPNKILDIEIRNEKIIRLTYLSTRWMMKRKFYKGGYSTRLEEWIPPKLISDKYEFIYVVNPVTGTRSILKKLYESSEYETSFRRVKRGSIKEWDEYMVFTTVRNPFSRLVSAWRKQVLNASTVRKIGLICQYENIHPRMEFRDFVREVCSGAMDSHWAPQSELLREEGRDIEIDEYIKTENISEGYKEFSKRAGLPYSELPHSASSKELPQAGRYKKYKKYYEEVSSRSTKQLKRIYRGDITRFGYSVDI
jgi:hypothetical protein